MVRRLNGAERRERRSGSPLAALAAAALLAAALLAAAGCGGSGEGTRDESPGGDPGGPSRQSPELLWGREFRGVAVSGAPIEDAVATPASIRLSFAAERRHGIGWRARCNSYGATVRITRTQLQVGEVVGTLIGCPAEREREDEALAALLESDPEWTLRGERLTLSSGAGTLRLREAG